MIASYPGIETLLEDPPDNHGGPVRVRWAMLHHDPERLQQGKTTCRCRVWAVPDLDYFYEMEPSMSKRLAEDTQDTLKYVLENGEPEEEEEVWVFLTVFPWAALFGSP